MAPETAMELALRQKKAGVKELFSWDGNHKAKRPPILCAEKFISDSSILYILCRI